MSENDHLLSQIKCLEKLIKAQKTLAKLESRQGVSKEIDGYSRKRETRRKKNLQNTEPQTLERVEHAQLQTKRSSEAKAPTTKQVSTHVSSNLRSRYKWTATSASAVSGTDVKSKPVLLNSSHTVEPKISVQSASLPVTRAITPKLKADLPQEGDLKDSALNFLQEKLSKRKVFVNKHHTTFSTVFETGHCDSAEKRRADARKAEAVDFLHRAGVVENRVSNKTLRSSQNSSHTSQRLESSDSTQAHKEQVKIDKRSQNSPSIGEEGNRRGESIPPTSRNTTASQSRYKLVRTTSGHKTAHLCGEKKLVSTSKSHCQVGKSSNRALNPARSEVPVEDNAFTKVGKYKLVKSKDSSRAQHGTTVATNNTKESKSTLSRYRLVNRTVTSDSENQSEQGSRQRKRSASSFKWTRPGIGSTTKPLKRVSAGGRASSSTGNLSLPSTTRTPQNIRLRTRFRLSRKSPRIAAAKLSPVNRNKSVRVAGRITRSKFKLVNPRSPRDGASQNLEWKNRFSLKRNNASGVHKVDINQLLGRKVVNLSRNKYKFVSVAHRKQPKKGYISTVPARVLQRKLRQSNQSKFKIDRRPRSEASQILHSPQRSSGANFVMIGGILYKSSTRQLVKTASKVEPSNKSAVRKGRIYSLKSLAKPRMRAVIVRGIKYEMDPTGRTLQRVQTTTSETGAAMKRLDIGGVTYIQTRPGTLVKAVSHGKRIVASRSLHKSIVRTTTGKRKAEKKYCLFYNRFGKCNRGSSCSFLHDPDKVAICTRFLRGTCKVVGCPFSHKVAKDKMPVCLHFLRGTCNRDNCPYRHVKVSQNAEVCEDFLNGYCPRGEKCNKQHTLICLEFVETGVCPRPGKCRLFHPKKTQKRKNRFAEDSESSSRETKVRRGEGEVDDRHLPMSKRHLPAFIALSSDSREETVSDKIPEERTVRKAAEPLKIRPSFK